MLSPKQIGTICFAIFSILISAPSFADPDIAPSASSADCKYAPLETYTGTSNLQADWRANEIALHWYDGDTEITSGVQTSCVYDGTFVPPTPTPREGYVFTGWRVRIPTYDFTMVPTNGYLIGYVYGVGWYNDENIYIMIAADGSGESFIFFGTEVQDFLELETYEWKLKYSHGDLYGTSKCSTTGGTYGQPGTPSDTNGRYCWCKATGYKVGGVGVTRGPSTDLSWVFNKDDGSGTDCAKKCAASCAERTGASSDFLRSLLGVQ